MQQLQPEEAALLAHMQASFNAVANKIKQASNDAKLNPFKEPTPPPQGSARQVRIRYYHCDQLGTPKELTSSSGELVWYAQYKAWGNTVKVEWLQGPAGQEAGFEWGQVEGANSTGNENSSRGIQSHKQTQAQVQPIRFQGQYYDWETGLHYNRFRYYDPDCGRFICKDPIGLAGGLNLFQYAPNQVGWIDPLGLVCGINGNTKAINNDQHVYVIYDHQLKIFAKTGISGGKIRLDGKSYRAERQVRALNNQPGNSGRYSSRIVKKIPSKPCGSLKSSREDALDEEQAITDKLFIKGKLDPNIHRRPAPTAALNW